MVNKIKLADFKQSELTVNQLLELKGGSGSSSSQSGSCRCSGNDTDKSNGDSDW